MSDEYFADLYEWLAEAYDNAMGIGQPQLAMQYVMQMRALEQAGIMSVEKVKETIH